MPALRVSRAPRLLWENHPVSRRPMTPVETASAGILAGLSIAVLVLGTALLGTGLPWLAAIPMAVLAHQHRLRAVVAGTVAVVVVASVAGGLPSALGAVITVLGGAAVGLIRRRGWGWGAALVAALGLGLLSAAATIGTFLLFSESLTLFLDALRASMVGVASAMQRVGLMGERQVELWHRIVDLAVEHWQVYIAIGTTLTTGIGILVAYWALGVVLRRLRLDTTVDPLVESLADASPVGPLPVHLEGVSYRYPEADREALSDIRLTLTPGETIALVGPNGSGKSTLGAILAGATPTNGTVQRPGSAGLGRPGGTALLAQRSELQMLGETVADDVRWGCSPDDDVDVDGLLALVGLVGRHDDRPSTLSGGELQRLALAGALARRPALLVSDESTAMVDPAGRAELMAVLRSLPARLGTTVVHVTHDPDEAAGMDRTIRLVDGRIVSDTPTADIPPLAAPQRAAVPVLPMPGATVLTLSGVGHTYHRGTPWETTALEGIDLELRAGEGVLVTGSNGSGKSTLARIMAGLLAPTAGWCEAVPNRPMRMTVGRVALAMQFSRLQLRRPTVGADILDAVNIPSHEPLLPPERGYAAWALDQVGLPAALADRSIDRLSGGQMRRVALAGLLATKPAVLVLDEPFAGLDAESREALSRTLVRELHRGLALVVITHDVHGLESICTRRLVLDRGRLA